jgi:ABC-type uncharacterized transport system permease subunit
MRWRRFNAYLAVIRMNMQEDRANPMRLIGGVGLGVVRLIIIAALYKAAYEVAAPAQLPYANALWGIGLYFAFVLGLGPRSIFKIVNEEVKTGAVEVGLIKPLDWRLVKVCQLLGKNMLEFVVSLLVNTTLLLVLTGAPDMSYMTLPSTALYLGFMVVATITILAIYLTIGLAAFWLGDAMSLFRLVDKCVMILAGAFVPVALFPELLQAIIRYSPFGVIAAVTQLFNERFFTNLLPTCISAIVWSVALLGFCQWIWNRACVKIEVNGG